MFFIKKYNKFNINNYISFSIANTTINFYIYGSFLILLAVIYVFQNLGIDLKIQKQLYKSYQGWPISGYNVFLKYIFYIIPKKIITVIIIVYLYYLIKYSYLKDKFLSKVFLYLFLSSILSIITVSVLKHNTNIYCPDNINLFGGKNNYHKISDLKLPNNINKPGKCFPAGHASAGYSIISLAFIMKKRRNKIIVFLGVSTIGSLMGAYQILRGVHYVGDTLVSFVISIIFALLTYKLTENIKKN